MRFALCAVRAPHYAMLKADAIQRYQAVRHTLQEFVRPGLRILDVGGGSGDLPKHFQDCQFFAADIVSPWGTNAVRATGTRLPFEDRAFDITVSLDTFEHVPPAARGDFLRELVRVARTAVILTAPFDAPGVDAAERIVDSAYRERHGEGHPWLSEHLAHARPVLEDALETLAQHSVTVTPLGHLPLWTRLQLLDIHLDSVSHGADVGEEINRAYTESLAAADRLEPCYRRLLAVRLDGGAPFPGPPESGEETLHALLRFEELLSRCAARLAEKGGVTDRAGLDRALIDSYQSAISEWESAYAETLKSAEEGHRWQSEFRARRSVRWLRGLLRLVGRDL